MRLLFLLFLLFSMTQWGVSQATSVGYVDIAELHPGQTRYSSRNVAMKFAKKRDQGEIFWDKDHWVGKYQNGKSGFSLENPIPVIQASFGYIPLDGHHDILVSLQAGLPAIPIVVVADWRDLDEAEVWERAEQEGFAYLIDIQGNRRIPPEDFRTLEDDPLRFFAAITAKKYVDGTYQGSGPENPLWVKQGRDIPFIEFRIADILYAAGFSYDYTMGEPPSEELVEEARQILLEHPVPGLEVVKNHGVDQHEVPAAKK